MDSPVEKEDLKMGSKRRRSTSEYTGLAQNQAVEADPAHANVFKETLNSNQTQDVEFKSSDRIGNETEDLRVKLSLGHGKQPNTDDLNMLADFSGRMGTLVNEGSCPSTHELDSKYLVSREANPLTDGHVLLDQKKLNLSSIDASSNHLQNHVLVGSSFQMSQTENNNCQQHLPRHAYGDGESLNVERAQDVRNSYNQEQKADNDKISISPHRLSQTTLSPRGLNQTGGTAHIHQYRNSSSVNDEEMSTSINTYFIKNKDNIYQKHSQIYEVIKTISQENSSHDIAHTAAQHPKQNDNLSTIISQEYDACDKQETDPSTLGRELVFKESQEITFVEKYQNQNASKRSEAAVIDTTGPTTNAQTTRMFSQNGTMSMNDSNVNKFAHKNILDKSNEDSRHQALQCRSGSSLQPASQMSLRSVGQILPVNMCAYDSRNNMPEYSVHAALNVLSMSSLGKDPSSGHHTTRLENRDIPRNPSPIFIDQQASDNQQSSLVQTTEGSPRQDEPSCAYADSRSDPQLEVRIQPIPQDIQQSQFSKGLLQVAAQATGQTIDSTIIHSQGHSYGNNNVQHAVLAPGMTRIDSGALQIKSTTRSYQLYNDKHSGIISESSVEKGSGALITSERTQQTASQGYDQNLAPIGSIEQQFAKNAAVLINHPTSPRGSQDLQDNEAARAALDHEIYQNDDQYEKLNSREEARDGEFVNEQSSERHADHQPARNVEREDYPSSQRPNIRKEGREMHYSANVQSNRVLQQSGSYEDSKDSSDLKTYKKVTLNKGFNSQAQIPRQQSELLNSNKDTNQQPPNQPYNHQSAALPLNIQIDNVNQQQLRSIESQSHRTSRFCDVKQDKSQNSSISREQPGPYTRQDLNNNEMQIAFKSNNKSSNVINGNQVIMVSSSDPSSLINSGRGGHVLTVRTGKSTQSLGRSDQQQAMQNSQNAQKEETPMFSHLRQDTQEIEYQMGRFKNLTDLQALKQQIRNSSKNKDRKDEGHQNIDINEREQQQNLFTETNNTNHQNTNSGPYESEYMQQRMKQLSDGNRSAQNTLKSYGDFQASSNQLGLPTEENEQEYNDKKDIMQPHHKVTGSSQLGLTLNEQNELISNPYNTFLSGTLGATGVSNFQMLESHNKVVQVRDINDVQAAPQSDLNGMHRRGPKGSMGSDLKDLSCSKINAGAMSPAALSNDDPFNYMPSHPQKVGHYDANDFSSRNLPNQIYGDAYPNQIPSSQNQQNTLKGSYSYTDSLSSKVQSQNATSVKPIYQQRNAQCFAGKENKNNMNQQNQMALTQSQPQNQDQDISYMNQDNSGNKYVPVRSNSKERFYPDHRRQRSNQPHKLSMEDVDQYGYMQGSSQIQRSNYRGSVRSNSQNAHYPSNNYPQVQNLQFKKMQLEYTEQPSAGSKSHRQYIHDNSEISNNLTNSTLLHNLNKSSMKLRQDTYNDKTQDTSNAMKNPVLIEILKQELLSCKRQLMDQQQTNQFLKKEKLRAEHENNLATIQINEQKQKINELQVENEEYQNRMNMQEAALNHENINKEGFIQELQRMNDLQTKETQIVRSKLYESEGQKNKQIETLTNDITQMKANRVKHVEKVYSQLMQICSVVEHLKDMIKVAEIGGGTKNDTAETSSFATQQIIDYIELNFESNLRSVTKIIQTTNKDLACKQALSLNQPSASSLQQCTSLSSLENKSERFQVTDKCDEFFGSSKLKTRAQKFKQFRHSTEDLIKKLFDNKMKGKVTIINDLENQLIGIKNEYTQTNEQRVKQLSSLLTELDEYKQKCEELQNTVKELQSSVPNLHNKIREQANMIKNNYDQQEDVLQSKLIKQKYQLKEWVEKERLMKNENDRLKIENETQRCKIAEMEKLYQLQQHQQIDFQNQLLDNGYRKRLHRQQQPHHTHRTSSTDDVVVKSNQSLLIEKIKNQSLAKNQEKLQKQQFYQVKEAKIMGQQIKEYKDTVKKQQELIYKLQKELESKSSVNALDKSFPNTHPMTGPNSTYPSQQNLKSFPINTSVQSQSQYYKTGRSNYVPPPSVNPTNQYQQTTSYVMTPSLNTGAYSNLNKHSTFDRTQQYYIPTQQYTPTSNNQTKQITYQPQPLQNNNQQINMEQYGSSQVLSADPSYSQLMYSQTNLDSQTPPSNRPNIYQTFKKPSYDKGASAQSRNDHQVSLPQQHYEQDNGQQQYTQNSTIYHPEPSANASTAGIPPSQPLPTSNQSSNVFKEGDECHFIYDTNKGPGIPNYPSKSNANIQQHQSSQNGYKNIENLKSENFHSIDFDNLDNNNEAESEVKESEVIIEESEPREMNVQDLQDSKSSRRYTSKQSHAKLSQTVDQLQHQITKLENKLAGPRGTLRSTSKYHQSTVKESLDLQTDYTAETLAATRTGNLRIVENTSQHHREDHRQDKILSDRDNSQTSFNKDTIPLQSPKFILQREGTHQ